MTRTKIVVGLSGGVDSSVAAALLVEQGYEVEGVFMKNFDPNVFFKQAKEVFYDIESGCHWQEDQEDARQVCKTLGIPFKVWNFEKEYYRQVMDYFLEEYKAGRTPNPDVLCNRQVKFGAFLKKACKSGAGYIATGHYARKREITYPVSAILSHPSSPSAKAMGDRQEGIMPSSSSPLSKGGYVQLLKGMDTNKDQSYFLYAISQAALTKTLFPIGDLTKAEVREMAEKRGLITSRKKDSQGICFVGEVDLKKFLQQYIKDKPGKIIDLDSYEVVGKHDGLSWYTIGQRRGMSVGGTGLPLYVAGKDLEKNELYVVKGNHNPYLYKNELQADNLSWISAPPDLPQRLQAKVRYRQADQDCQVSWLAKDKLIKVEFKKPQRAITPGQSVVFYQGEVCLGGGVIK